MGRLYNEIQFRGCNIYNLDEKGLMMGVANRSKVIVRRGSKLQALCQDTNRELITIVECICADGTTVSPMIIFKGAAHYYGWHPDSATTSGDTTSRDSDKFVYGFSDKGYIDYNLLLGWLQTAFEPQTAEKLAHPREWRLLIWDGHESHMNFDVLNFCNSHRIKIFKLPSHSTHLLQPLDLVVFSAFQHHYSCEIDKASRLGRSGIGKHNFLQFLKPARKATFRKPELVHSAFRISGIWPYDPTQVYDHIILPPPQPAAPAATALQRDFQSIKSTLMALNAPSTSLQALSQIQSASEQLTAQVALHQHHTEQLQRELNQQRGGKHDRRVLSKARVVDSEFIKQRKAERDQEAAAVGSKTKKAKKRPAEEPLPARPARSAPSQASSSLSVLNPNTL